MADDKNNLPELPPISAQKNAAIGDENIPAAKDLDVDVNKDEAEVFQTPPVVRADTVPVYEVVVHTDEVIRDPNHPLASQVPDAGRGNALLPIHAHVNARLVEDIFAEAGGEVTVSDEDRAASQASGTTPKSARGKSADKS
jgi:hypothetical protein